MTRFGLLIDIRRCIGCRTCVATCMVENFNLLDKPWNFVVEYEVGEYPNVRREFVTMACMHCDEPACMKACDAVGAHAISKNEYGVVLIDYEKCIGCRYCIAACPYGAPRYIDEIKYAYEGSPTPYELIPNEKRHPTHRKKAGIVEKCTLCWHRLERAIEEGKTPGESPEYTPACVVNCPTHARIFGDLDDPNSEISRLVAEKNAVQLKKEFGTQPKTFYILTGGE